MPAGLVLALPDFGGGLVAVHDGHLHVHQHDIEFLCGERVDRLESVHCHDHLMPARQQQSECNAAIDFVVLDQQHAARMNRRGCRQCRRLHRLDARVPTELAQHLVEQFGRDDRLGHEPADTVFLAQFRVDRRRTRRDHDDRTLALIPNVAQALGKVETIFAGHVVVEQNQSDGMRGLVGCLQRVSGDCGGVGQHRSHVPVLQHLAQDAAVREVVVHDQHRQVEQRFEFRRFVPMLIVGDFQFGGEVKRRTTTGFAFDPDLAVHHFHELSRDRQAQPRAAEPSCRRGFGLLERTENLDQLVGGNSDPRVADREMQPGPFGGDRLDIEVHKNFAGFGELHGVPEQIDEYLLNAAGITEQMVGDFWRDATDDLQSLLCRTQHQHLRRAADAFRDPEVHTLQFQLARLDLGEVEDVVEQPQQNVGRLIDGRQIVALVRPQFGARQQLRHADDAIHRCADFVAHVGQERTLGLVGGFGSLLGSMQFDFVSPALRRVTEHDDATSQLVRLIP